ncbi:MAG: GTP 3',8-cyclase MoaA [Deltaproteobacteria bacterium]|nr:GTP 3',8-cyclase MoaA [Deltaproteobacteria bacterium]
MLRDSFGRLVDYLRLSVTDRCNLRCLYCMPPEGIPLKPVEEILTYEELLRCVRVAVSLGVRKVRVTGGEPLVRGGVVDFIRRLSAIPGVADLGMTTNGIGLAEVAGALRQAGLGRVNISLDTIRRDRYAEITRRDRLPDVISGIDAAVREGFSPVKINVVLLHGLLPGEVDDFLGMARDKRVEVRFIERMPMGCLPSEGYVSADRIRDRILSLPGVREARSEEPSAAVRYEVRGFAGTVGIISPISRKFCSDCNRLRITADGRIRNCLFARETLDLRSVLRRGRGDREVAAIFRKAVITKPEGHDLCAGGGSPATEPMSRIGG